MDIKTENKAEQSKKVRNTVGLSLTVVMLGLTVYVLYIQSDNYKTLEASSDLSLNANVKQSENYRHYVKQYVNAKSQLVETQARLGKMTLELELVSKELESTKSMLSETENLLAQTQQENSALKGDPVAAANLQKIYSARAGKDVEHNLKGLQQRNENYTGELAKLKSELGNYQSDVADLKEGRSLIYEFRSKIKAVKEKMRDLKRAAAIAKEEAQNERDRQLALLGNNGYATKDGQLVLVSPSNSSAPATAKTVDIEVKFVP